MLFIQEEGAVGWVSVARALSIWSKPATTR